MMPQATPRAAGARRERSWKGQELGGQRIVLHADVWQEDTLRYIGLGDTLHFVRYASLVEERGGEVVLEVQRPVIPILRQSGFREVVPLGAEISPACQWHAPIASLPRLFGTTLETIPASIPYLSADDELIRTWSERLAPYKGLKVGIQWCGGSASQSERRRISLLEFEPLALVSGVTLISLQQHEGCVELAALGDRFPVVDLGADVDKAHGPFMDTAAIMRNLDLVVSCDTSVVHLAGALGVPVWVALMLAPDWRWLTDRQDTPWYPTVRLFRQTHLDDWSGVFHRMAAELSVYRPPEPGLDSP